MQVAGALKRPSQATADAAATAAAGRPPARACPLPEPLRLRLGRLGLAVGWVVGVGGDEHVERLEVSVGGRGRASGARVRS